MRFQIQNLREPGPELGCILGALAESSLEALQHFNEEPAEQIHLLRTNMKKIRALIRLARVELPAIAFEQATADVRRLKQSYAGTRDEQELHRLFQRLATSMEASALPELFDLTQHDPPPPSDELRQTAERLRNSFAHLPFWAVTARGVHQALNHTLRQGEKVLRECRILQTDHAYHQWRKCVKVLWYQAALLNDSRARLAARVSESLGLANDLANLRLRLYPLPPGTVPVSLADRLEQNLADAREKALDRGRKLYS